MGPQNATGVFNSTNTPFGQQDAYQNTVRPAGWLMGIPIYPDSNVTTTDGASTNADQILVGSFKNAILWESGSPREFTFDGVASANVNLRLQLVHYAAFIVRLPAAFSLISGVSLAPPVFTV